MVYGNGGETQQVWLDLGLLTHVELRGATQHHLPQFPAKTQHNTTIYQGYQASLSRVYAKLQDPEPQRCCLSF